MTQFYNPYHFVPCAKKTPGSIPLEAFDRGEPEHVTHAKWLATSKGQKIHNGRIVCKLTAETPLVIGAQQEKSPNRNSPTKVKPFELDMKPAIPGSSLRGLISSVAEAASNSALRVLTNSIYSYRKEMSESLSAMGMIRVTSTGTEDVYDLLPLALPHMTAMPNQPFRIEQSTPEAPNNQDSPTFRSHGKYTSNMFRYASLKYYFGHHRPEDPANCISEKQFLDYYLSPDRLSPDFYYAPIPRVTLDHRGCIQRTDTLHCKRYNRGSDIVLGVSHREVPEIMPDDGDANRQLNTKGIVRVLGCTQERSIPLWQAAQNGRRERQGKKHEIFIPWPWPDATIPDDAWVRLTQEVIARFHQIADTCTSADPEHASDLASHPYHLWDTKRNRADNPKDHRFRLKTGDIVFFRPDDAGTGIAEVSISSIWRGRVETIVNPGHKLTPVTTWKFFEDINPDLLPAGAPAKKQLTLAELLFGFVEQNKGNTSRALASRVRVSNAHIQGPKPTAGWYLPEKTLKILGSPKPPSPALYFGPGYKQKNQIAKDVQPNGRIKQNAEPNGRKFYLHHGTNPLPQEWESANHDPKTAHMKVSVTPLRVEADQKPEFWFHLDFDNLTDTELGCLLYSLRPTASFRHKLGLGKPLGLGTVRIDVAGLYLVKRADRYAKDDPFSLPDRYHTKNIANLMKGAPTERYRFEIRSATAPDEDVLVLRDKFRDLMQTEGLGTVLDALETLGDPAKIDPQTKVHYPQLAGQPNEGEHFKWFVRNDKIERGQEPAREVLRPITNGTIPKLTRHPPV